MRPRLIFFLGFTILSITIASTTTKIYSGDDDNVIKMFQILIHIMFECRKDFDTVFVYNKDKRFSIGQLSFTERPVSVLLYNNSMISSYESHLPATEIDAFILVIHRGMLLKNVIRAITSHYGADSAWQTIAPFYILDESKDNCLFGLMEQIYLHLYNYHAIHEMYFICHERKELTNKILTVNPHDKQAPHPWVKIPSKYGSRITLLSQDFNGNICTNLYFNRMKYLAGYDMKFAVGLWNKSGSYNESFYNKDELSMLLYPPDRMYIESLIIALKIKAKFFFFDANDPESIASMMKICRFNLILLASNKNKEQCYDSLYPTRFGSFSFVTHSKGMKTPLEQMRDYYGIWTLVSMIVLLSLAFTVIWMIRRDWSFAGFEVLRLLINSGIEVELNNLSRKIFFSMIFLYFLVFHSTLSGHLVKFINKPDPRRNPETIDELANDPQYTEIISTVSPLLYLQTHPIYSRMNMTININECFKKVLYSKSTVCLDTEENVRYRTELKKSQMKDSPYHIPKKGFGSMYISVYVRQNLATKSYIEKVHMNAVEAGLFSRIVQDNYPVEAIKIRTAEMASLPDFRALTLQALLFGFILLGFGLIFASIIFIAEICLSQSRTLRIQKLTQAHKIHATHKSCNN